MTSELSWLCGVSKRSGSVNLVQGTGGNTSVKAGNKLIIKASGTRLDKVSETSGHVTLDLDKIPDIVSLTETEANKAIQGAVVENKYNKPSIETGFHTFLDKYVVHLHPISFNLILCSNDGEKLSKEIFSDFNYLWVPYRKVGYKLSTEIKTRLDKINEKPELILLENHGIIISSGKESRYSELFPMLESKILEHLKGRIREFRYNSLIRDGNSFTNPSRTAIDFLRNKENSRRFLFPDAAVFTTHLFSDNIGNKLQYSLGFENSSNIDENLMAHIYLIENIQRFSSPKFLNGVEIMEILDMESEKYRRKLIGIM